MEQTTQPRTRQRTNRMPEPWQRAWRNGFAPQLDCEALEAVRLGLLRGDACLLQGATSSPPAVEVFFADRLEACCILSFGFWQTGRLSKVADLESHYKQLCVAADDALGEPGACGAFLNWYDQTPREVMRRALLREVNRLLNRRRPTAAA
jgi:hypothetical protein